MNVVWKLDEVYKMYSDLFQGEAYGRHFRFWSGKILLTGFCLYSAAYYFKYNGNVSFYLFYVINTFL